MLDSRQLTAIQGFAARTLDLTCTITRATLTPTNIGASASTATVASGVACGLATPSAALLAVLATDAVGDVPQWVVSLPAGTDVRVGDVLAIGADRLRVQALRTPQSYSTLVQVLATEVR